jgi:hypothetical protein
MEKIVDVARQVYGKTYQTLVALKTLMLHSGKYIDRIYFEISKYSRHGWGPLLGHLTLLHPYNYALLVI